VVEIDVTCHIESFRRFLINSTCRSFVPESYLRDPEVFPEKESEPGSIYIEAADKVTLKRIRDISFVNANEVLGIIYTSKSGNSRLKWRQLRGPMGRVTGDASNHSLVNLSMARVITPEYVEELARREQEMGHEAPAQEEQPHSAPPASAEVIAEIKKEAASESKPPSSGQETIPLDESEDDFDAADADEDEVDDLEDQEREDGLEA